MKLVEILISALRGIAANATQCKACQMNAHTARWALDKYYGKKEGPNPYADT